MDKAQRNQDLPLFLEIDKTLQAPFGELNFLLPLLKTPEKVGDILVEADERKEARRRMLDQAAAEADERKEARRRMLDQAAAEADERKEARRRMLDQAIDEADRRKEDQIIKNNFDLKYYKIENNVITLDHVEGPFYDYKLDKLGNAIYWETYYRVNGIRMSEDQYLLRKFLGLEK